MDTVYVHYGSDKFDYDKLKKSIDLVKALLNLSIIDKLLIDYMELEKDYDEEMSRILRIFRLLPSKPIGLWSSREITDYGWKDYCTNEGYENKYGLEKSFKFKLKEESKILTINCEDDILPYIINEDEEQHKSYIFKKIDWFECKTSTIDKLDRQKLYDEYDALEIPDICALPRFSMFYMYDCDSICIWNPDIIIPV